MKLTRQLNVKVGVLNLHDIYNAYLVQIFKFLCHVYKLQNEALQQQVHTLERQLSKSREGL